MRDALMRAPFPWFGGKSRVSHIVWDYFGAEVRNYVEPFAGSLAVLLGRPGEPRIETVNDLDCYIANFWRAIHRDPEAVAHWADWPVNEADLHARHLWLVQQSDFRDRMKADPDHYDAKIAGWWVWGISQWIGSGWCSQPDWKGRTNAGGHARGIHVTGGHKRPRLGNDHGRGVLRVTNQLPDLSGDSGAAGRGIHARALHAKLPKQIPYLGGHSVGQGVHTGSIPIEEKGGLCAWFDALAQRLRRVRVCCGDWARILGPAPTTCIGTTAVFLDPPYAVEERSDVYNEESRDLAHDVRAWAIENGDNPELRIALCGYQGEHAMPEHWTEVAWKANGGFANQKRSGTQGQQNAHRERIWFSPACLHPQASLFEALAAGETLW